MEQIPSILPVLPIRNAVLFPTTSMPLVVGRPRSMKAIEQAEGTHSLILVVAQSAVTPSDPEPDDLYRIGTLCKIESSSSTELGSRQVVVTGVARYSVEDFKVNEEGYLTARGELVVDSHNPDLIRGQALLNSLKQIAHEVIELLPGVTEPLLRLIDRVDDAAYLTNVCSAYLNIPLPEKQVLLETSEVEERMEKLLHFMRKEREVLSIQREIRDKMSERLTKAEREALLREQMRTIRQELGEEAGDEQVEALEDRIRKAGLSGEANKVAFEELKRLKSLPPVSAEYHVVRTYLELLAVLPWKHKSEDTIDLARARKILDEDHYGLEHVKKRILQYLAVAKLKQNMRGPILCLVGPPGVGKTSLGQSIARALSRKFIRTSLGGVRDEAEIRGHRRTYVGAMPGRVIQSLKRVGTKNPLMMLDEIDKLRADFHGDPSSAMLEVLDPEQNNSFTDHYLDVPFDLSDVFFVATANVLDTIPGPLRDRMEIIEVNGYTTYEKLHIAKKHLVPKQLKEHGIDAVQVELPESTLLKIISHYTREAGVRDLERKIAALFRGAAEEIVQLREVPVLADGPMVPAAKVSLSPERLLDLLGNERFVPEFAERVLKPGVTTGLAWTPHGGDLLYMEATRMPGKGGLTLTGQLGDVMKESAQIALSLARSTIFSLTPQGFDFAGQDIHIHVPAGAIPKDGPSAGVTILTALASLMINRTIDPKLAMTGEITLRGAVLPVGGIKEKVLAAHRAEMKTLILPKRNEQDLRDVPQDVLKDLRFIFANTVEEVLEHALGLRFAQAEQLVIAA